MGEPFQGAPAVGERATSSALVLRGGAWNIFSRIVPTLYTLVISIAAARFLGAEAFGRQSFIAFIELSLVFFLTTGISGGLTRYIGDSIGRERPQDVARMMRWAWLVEVVAALAGASVLVGAAAAGADPQGAWLFAAVGCFVGVLHAVPSALLGGLQLWRAATIVGVVSGVFTAAATVAVLAAGGGITEMFAIGAAGSIVNLAGTTLLARRAVRNLPAPAHSASRERRDLIRGLTRFSLASSYGVLVYLIVWRRSEFFFLEHFSGDLAVAIYSVPFAAVMALTQVPEALSAVVLPAFATLAGARAQERIRLGFGRALRLLLLTTLPVTAGALALGPRLLEAVWGAEFEESGPVFLVMVAPLPLLALLYISKALAMGLGKLRVVLLVDTVAALINVSLALLLIPRYDALGAAFAHVAAQVVSAVPILVYALRLAGGTEWKPRALVPAALASAGAGAAAAALLAVVGGVAGLILATVAGTAVFAILAVMLKILPREDAEWLETNAGRSVARLSRLVSGPSLQAS